MSVQFNHYVIIGTKLDYEKVNREYKGDNLFGDLFEGYEDDKWRKEVKEKNGLSCMYDGMCRKYIFLGKILAKTVAETEGFDGIVKLDTNMDGLRETIKQNLIKYFGQFCNNDTDVSLYVFTHVS